MFLELDIVEFTDTEVPFTPIVLNCSFIRQVQRIDNNMQSKYLQLRERQLAKKREQEISKVYDEPDVIVPPDMELPSQGAAIIMAHPIGHTYYTTTPYKDVRDQLIALNHSSVVKEDD